MDSDGFKWIQVDPGGFRWIQMDSGGFRWIQVDLGGSRWIQMDSNGFRWIQMDSGGSSGSEGTKVVLSIRGFKTLNSSLSPFPVASLVQSSDPEAIALVVAVFVAVPTVPPPKPLFAPFNCWFLL